MQQEVFVLYNSQPYVDCTAGLSKSYVILHSGFEASFVFRIICSRLGPVVIKSDGNFPVLSPAPVCYLPPPLRCRVLSVHHVLSRGRLVEVDACLSPEAKHMGHNRKTPPILLLLLLFLFSLFASPFSDKLLLTVISLTLSLIFLCLILLSHPPVSAWIVLVACFICFRNH